MKRLLICLALMAAVCPKASAVEWFTDLPTALTRARAEGKAVLLDFTGSDWCGWCKKLKQEVFDKPEFDSYANVNLVMVEVDFPHHKPIAPDLKQANHALAAKYGVRGYPTVILLDSDGEQIGKSQYVPGGPKSFIADIDKYVHAPHSHAAGTREFASAGATPHPAPQRRPPVFEPPPPIPVRQYDDLTLKGVSGIGNQRFALINNDTLMTGETGKVKLHGTNIVITVKEIHDDSAVIVVEGRPRELKLGSSL
jgi:protein disulfide-isomerase